MTQPPMSDRVSPQKPDFLIPQASFSAASALVSCSSEGPRNPSTGVPFALSSSVRLSHGSPAPEMNVWTSRSVLALGRRGEPESDPEPEPELEAEAEAVEPSPSAPESDPHPVNAVSRARETMPVVRGLVRGLGRDM